MIGNLVNMMLPQCCLVPIESRRRFFGQYPLLWNLANFISIFRVVMFVIVLATPYFNQDAVIVWYVLLTFSDKIDGWVAVLTGNNIGAGIVIDPLCDKLFHFLGLQYLLFSKLLEPAILGWLALLFEMLTLAVAYACAQFIWNWEKAKPFKQAWAILMHEMKIWCRVGFFGKAKMTNYFLGIFFLLIYLYPPDFLHLGLRGYVELRNLYIFFFTLGICTSIIAFSLYTYEAIKWYLGEFHK